MGAKTAYTVYSSRETSYDLLDVFTCHIRLTLHLGNDRHRRLLALVMLLVVVQGRRLIRLVSSRQQLLNWIQ